MFQKLDEVEKRYEEVTKKISDPEIIAQQSQWQTLMKEHAEIEPVVLKYREYKKANQAIEDAKENAKLNDIQNAEFMVGDVEFALSELIEKRNIIPDVVFVDPPRRGLDTTTIKNLEKVKPEKIVYISCNPATLVRDLKMFEEEYEIKSITPVDLFPWTKHVECVSVLCCKN